MICAKPGWNEPMTGQNVYILMKDGKPVGATLRYPSVVWQMGQNTIDEFVEVRWLG